MEVSVVEIPLSLFGTPTLHDVVWGLVVQNLRSPTRDARLVGVYRRVEDAEESYRLLVECKT